MLLSEVLDQLTYGELSQLAVSGFDDDSKQFTNYAAIVGHINLGLTELHKRFPLREKEVIVRQQANIQNYILHSSHSVYSTSVPKRQRYIHDSKFEPFIDDILVIDRVYNEIGTEIPLNTNIEYGENEALNTRFVPYFGGYPDHFAQSAQTLNYNTVQILPHPIPENNFLVVYRANHPKILANGLLPSEVEIEISPVLLEPLVYYIGARIMGNMTGAGLQDGMSYTQKFEQAVQQIILQGLVSRPNIANTKPRRAGWV